MNLSLLCLFFICCLQTPSKSWILPKSVTYDPYLPKRLGVEPLFAKKKKPTRIRVTLECSVARKEGVPASRYYTTKSRVNTPRRLQLMKYNRYLRRHTLHKEI